MLSGGLKVARARGVAALQVGRLSQGRLKSTVTALNESAETYAQLDEVLRKSRIAQEEFCHYDQAKTDSIFAAVSRELNKHRLDLAKATVAETGMGIVEDKTMKNAFAAEYSYKAYKDMKTCGVVKSDPLKGLEESAFPVGPIAAILPTTNPTSTVIAKTLISLKSRNAIVHLPHPRAVQASKLAADIAMKAALKAGAPENCIQCLDHISMDISKYVLQHPDTHFILATGGPGMVKATYTAGKPAIGVGAGNAPVIIDETCDLRQAVSSVIVGKTFDNGVICASEQSTVIVDEVYDEAKRLFIERGVFFCEGANREKLGKFMLKDGHLNADVVGQSAQRIAQMAGIEGVPEHAVVLAAEADVVSPDEPMSYEKLSPIIALYRASDYDNALETATALANFGGKGHTAMLYTKDSNTDRIRKFEEMLPAHHLLVNMPSAGAVGLSYNFNVSPSMTLGVGAMGGSSVAENVTPMHLIHKKKLAKRRDHMEWFKVPANIYFNRFSTREALADLKNAFGGDAVRGKKAMIITDQTMVDIGVVRELEDFLGEYEIRYSVFADVCPDPTMETVRQGVDACNLEKPDIIVGLGGGSPLDAAKMIRLFYEHPDANLDDLATRFMEIRQRTCKFPNTGSKVNKLVCISTTSGTGSEITPFAVITDDNGRKYPLCDYSLTPDIAIVDSHYTEKLPRTLIANSGFDSIAHSVESYVSVFASDYTRSLSLKATTMLSEHLIESYEEGDDTAREKIHNAAAMAGMAFSNAFLGINHSMAHALGAALHIPHGLAIALVFDEVVRFNSSVHPTRMAAFPQYRYPEARKRYVEIARALGVPEAEETVMVEGFLEKMRDLRSELNMPLTIQDTNACTSKEEYLKLVDELADEAFDDQCTGTNPRFPLIKELRQLFVDSWDGSGKKLTEEGRL
uniref:Aldehyde-alcohol dehydrogenase n=1 Tax=Mucochytrium quahogii TaxID=96639 RepID=A0A7S2WQ05_9STRA|mmetsp:Transcript_37351/g.60753  ORF Transcript_37351/g.60753 Transcript_37351/m.60753 type:complete len:914 (-) Transcript_37351:46-2787(-)|eukprot:CAMPEP_0203754990 /NCGR_PEP_ID=MMETSP0098-20131031/8515_1 /ASSEMBLY_ACC=CAM_ASM_000208 /TAXON_ID=96639 /ORGANISM=" , Strain NY0313808BC1" /LENGTH=913 /DNA_ID=CAMNT_0050646269 /DNA_START=101 /DNA_END=2838 /DNA_ORIENTATION=-